MIDYKKELREQLEEINVMIASIEKKIPKYKGLAEGSIRVTSCRGVHQYYFRKKGEAKKKYIESSKKDTVRLMLQREYDEKLLRELSNFKKRLESFLKFYDVGVIDRMYDGLCAGRKEMVIPIKTTTSMKLEELQKKTVGETNTIKTQTSYKTLKGEYVRSKSEKIIADYMYSMKIPYVYEPEFTLESGRHVYPDFAIYSIRKNKTLYWEHLGLVDNPEYAVKNFRKLIEYEKSGLVLGDTLLISAESAEIPLDFDIIKKKLDSVI